MIAEDLKEIVDALVDQGLNDSPLYFSEIVNGGEQFSPIEANIRLVGGDVILVFNRAK